MSLAGCSDDGGGPASSTQVIAACHEFNDAFCRGIADCGSIPGGVDACIADRNRKCPQELEPEWCWDEERDALEDCAADIRDQSCQQLCPNGNCSFTCTWLCQMAPG